MFSKQNNFLDDFVVVEKVITLTLFWRWWVLFLPFFGTAHKITSVQFFFLSLQCKFGFIMRLRCDHNMIRSKGYTLNLFFLSSFLQHYYALTITNLFPRRMKNLHIFSTIIFVMKSMQIWRWLFAHRAVKMGNSNKGYVCG